MYTYWPRFAFGLLLLLLGFLLFSFFRRGGFGLHDERRRRRAELANICKLDVLFPFIFPGEGGGKTAVVAQASEGWS